ncbi:MAG: tyrosine-type recombinase/integrase [Sulfuritalea sp.]|nr:tyrosine-type recombinase/integrase [Sulfuritalea sp.]
MQLKVPYLIEKRNASGGGRFYWQPSKAMRALGFAPVRLGAAEADAIAEARLWNERVHEARSGVAQNGQGVPGGPGRKTIKAGSLSALIRDYRRSRFYLDLRPKTRAGYDHNMKILEQWAGPTPVAWITRKQAEAFYNELRAATPSKAVAVMTMLYILFLRASTIYDPGQPGHMPAAANPAARMELKRPVARKLIWPRAAVDHFIAAADAIGRPSLGDAVELDYWLGQRPADVLAFPRSKYRDGVLDVLQQKTGARVLLPLDMVARVRTRLEAAAGRTRNLKIQATTLIVCELTGKPWVQSTFQHEFARVRAAAAATMPWVTQPHLEAPVAFTALQFRFLRHTAVTALKAAGCDNETVADVTGHSKRSIDDIIEYYRVPTAAGARTAFAKRLEKEQES